MENRAYIDIDSPKEHNLRMNYLATEIERPNAYSDIPKGKGLCVCKTFDTEEGKQDCVYFLYSPKNFQAFHEDEIREDSIKALPTRKVYLLIDRKICEILSDLPIQYSIYPR